VGETDFVGYFGVPGWLGWLVGIDLLFADFGSTHFEVVLEGNVGIKGFVEGVVQVEIVVGDTAVEEASGSVDMDVADIVDFGVDTAADIVVFDIVGVDMMEVDIGVGATVRIVVADADWQS
jgi:hypothetical protein